MAQTIKQKLAEQFRTIIQEWLTEEELMEVDKKNSTKKYIGCCATHDYCDANEAMDEAFTKVMGREMVFYDDEFPETKKQNEDDFTLINAAWDIAKEKKFSNQ